MDKKELIRITAGIVGKAVSCTARQTARALVTTAEFVHDHRAEIAKGSNLAARAAVSSVKGAAGFVYDTASLKVFSREKIDGLRSRIEEQGKEYCALVDARGRKHRVVDSIAVGGDLLTDILRGGASAEVEAAYAAAYPDLAKGCHSRIW